MMGKRTDESLLQQLRIDELEINRRKALFGLTPSDADMLLSARPHILGVVDAVVEDFYRRQTEIEDVARIIGDSETMRRLRVAQRRYIDDLFSGIYDADYVNDRLRVGLIHKRIGVEPKYYLSALSVLRQILHAAVAANLPDAARAAQVTAALDRLLDFDTAFVLDTYIRSLLSEIDAVREGARRYARTLEEKVAERTRELEMLSRHDALTGLLNRRAFADALRHEIVRARRAFIPIAVLYIDVDDFKAINDTRGHRRGDEALCTVADVLRQTSREIDVLARLGGDEFCAVLPGVDADGAGAYSLRLRDALHGRDGSFAVSIGVCCTGPIEFAEPDALLHAADTSMYRDKARHQSSRDSRITALAAN